jgi:hypothetical protein
VIICGTVSFSRRTPLRVVSQSVSQSVSVSAAAHHHIALQLLYLNHMHSKARDFSAPP